MLGCFRLLVWMSQITNQGRLFKKPVKNDCSVQCCDKPDFKHINDVITYFTIKDSAARTE